MGVTQQVAAAFSQVSFFFFKESLSLHNFRQLFDNHISLFNFSIQILQFFFDLFTHKLKYLKMVIAETNAETGSKFFCQIQMVFILSVNRNKTCFGWEWRTQVAAAFWQVFFLLFTKFLRHSVPTSAPWAAHSGSCMQHYAATAAMQGYAYAAVGIKSPFDKVLSGAPSLWNRI